MPLRQVLYVSQSTAAVSHAAEQQILGVSRRNNRRADLTGVLASSGRHFAQVLEGPDPAVDATLARIALDRRHERMTVVVDRSITERRFDGWSMAYIYNLDLADDLAALCAGQDDVDGESVLERLGRDSGMGSL